ncbi:acetoacetate decarboxylase family protein [Nocardia sp. CA-128927]|uniref:acetoacetate decarboxylase family protein n=1 Tax=Nocardia sp. CA-128927 TaxID=3239975 RepID=UPI003D95A672
MIEHVPAGDSQYGYAYPLSPTGKASLLSPPPWHFSGLVALAEYVLDPEQIQPFLPPGAVATAAGPNAAAVFSRWQCTAADGVDLARPSSSSFTEFQILLACSYQGQEYARCPFAWVDSAVSMARGWIQGMPKKIGDVAMTHELGIGKASPRREASDTYYGSAAADHRHVAHLEVSLTRAATRLPVLFERPMLHSLVHSPWLPGEQRRTELVSSVVEDVAFDDVWSGAAAFELGDAIPDLGLLRPLEIGDGFVFSYGETLSGGRSIADSGVNRKG